jgi:hypothetical protein
MRKIFSMIMVALVALFVATSCELASGTDPNPNRKDNLLWSRVNEVINQHYNHAVAVAHLNDILLDRAYIEIAYQPCDFMAEENTYTLRYGSTSSARSYRIKTDGKRLDEGGVWEIYYRTSTYAEYVLLGKATGIVGESSKFKLSIDNKEYAQSYLAYCYAAESEIEYEYDSFLRDCLCVKYNTFKGTIAKRSEQTDFTIEFEVVEPLVIYTSLEQGKIDILYKDLIQNISRELTVEIANKIVTFDPSNGSNR